MNIHPHLAKSLFDSAYRNVLRTFFQHTALDTEDGEQIRSDSELLVRFVGGAFRNQTLDASVLLGMQQLTDDYVDRKVDTHTLGQYIRYHHTGDARVAVREYVLETLAIIFPDEHNVEWHPVTACLIHTLERAL